MHRFYAEEVFAAEVIGYSNKRFIILKVGDEILSCHFYQGAESKAE